MFATTHLPLGLIKIISFMRTIELTWAYSLEYMYLRDKKFNGDTSYVLVNAICDLYTSETIVVLKLAAYNRHPSSKPLPSRLLTSQTMLDSSLNGWGIIIT